MFILKYSVTSEMFIKIILQTVALKKTMFFDILSDGQAIRDKRSLKFRYILKGFKIHKLIMKFEFTKKKDSSSQTSNYFGFRFNCFWETKKQVLLFSNISGSGLSLLWNLGLGSIICMLSLKG